MRSHVYEQVLIQAGVDWQYVSFPLGNLNRQRSLVNQAALASFLAQRHSPSLPPAEETNHAE